MTTEKNFFRDSEGREWEIRITYGDIKRVQSMLGINLAQAGARYTKEELARLSEDQLPIYLRLANDPCLLVDVIYGLIQPKAVEAKVASEDFGGSVTPAVFKEMSEIFWRVYHNFFVESGDKIRAKVIEAILKMMRVAEDNAGRMDAMIEKSMTEVNKEIETILS